MIRCYGYNGDSLSSLITKDKNIMRRDPGNIFIVFATLHVLMVILHSSSLTFCCLFAGLLYLDFGLHYNIVRLSGNNSEVKMFHLEKEFCSEEDWTPWTGDPERGCCSLRCWS